MVFNAIGIGFMLNNVIAIGIKFDKHMKTIYFYRPKLYTFYFVQTRLFYIPNYILWLWLLSIQLHVFYFSSKLF